MTHAQTGAGEQAPVHIEADYVIVGAGTSGCVLADRLSADGRQQVVVLEAGGWGRSPWIHIPIGYAKTFTDPRYNWMYETEAEPQLDGRRIYWPRGKLVGGSGSINGLVYLRGQPQDFDGWRDAGCEGWGFKDLLPYFRKSEDYHAGASELHGAGGPIAVSRPADRTELCERLIASAVAAGLPRTEDFNALGPGGEPACGVGYYDLTTRRGLRSSSGIDMLGRARKRANLRVLTHAQVQSLVRDGQRITGVAALHEGSAIVVRARKEVLLCAGAINSPQLLMVSGIGPGEMLQARGIAVAPDPAGIAHHVGRHLQDHLQCRMVLECKEALTQNDVLRSWTGRLGIGLNYFLRRRGLMTFAAGQVGMLFKSDPALARPDGQMLQFPFSAPKTGEPLHPFSGFTMTVSQMRPQSRGHIALKTSCMRDAPAIHANYLSTQADQDFYLRALRLVRGMLAHEPMSSTLAREYWPGPEVQDDAALLAYVRRMASTIFHPCGTVRMGKDAPLDASLRLRGFAGLRVVDASVMPLIPSGNINASCLAIAEKAADMVLRTG